jgi:glycerol-3-phosphate responsive antiterminator
MKKIQNVFDESPIIAAVKDDEQLYQAMATDCAVIFVLYGTICTIAQIVERIKDVKKIAIVHIDLIVGLSSKDIAVDFIKSDTKADGIISTKQNLVKRAVELDMYGGQRTFIVDSMALANTKHQLQTFRPSFLEIMPGTIYSVISELHSYNTVPLVAGGLLASKKDILTALDAGASAVSTTRQELWSV